MMRLVGILFSTARHIINAVTLIAAGGYAVFVTWWMHAPPFDVLQIIAPAGLVALAVAWVCGRIGRHLRDDTPLFPASPGRRWLLAAGAFVVLASSGTTLLAKKRQYDCSVDPSRTAEARDMQMRRDGFERVCEGDLARFDLSLGAIEGAVEKLAFGPVDLTRTPFSTFDTLGGRAETVNGIRSRLYRGFRTAEGQRVILFEHDMSADGTRSWRDPADEPERINGLPARLIVLEDTAGDAVSHLSWNEGRRAYELWIHANVVRTGSRARLFELAAPLPRSVPGCPNEVPPKPLRMGADGFPADDDPMPNSMTQAEMNARMSGAARPCR